VSQSSHHEPDASHAPEPALPTLADLRYDDAGLVPVVVQQHDTGAVLMVAWADRPALTRALEVGEAVFYSRSRQEQWHKGATSGNTQRLVEVRVDCDADVVLYLVDQGEHGVACHTGERSCFHRHLDGAPTGPSRAAPPLVAPEPARSERPEQPEEADVPEEPAT
jgi:phosphoribosyl-AMP cyclohydrolase